MWGRVLAGLVVAVLALTAARPAAMSSTSPLVAAGARLLVEPVDVSGEPTIDLALDLPLEGPAAGRIDVKVPPGFDLQPRRPLDSEPGTGLLQTATSSGLVRYSGELRVEPAPAEPAGCPARPVLARWGLQLFSQGQLFDVPFDFHAGEPSPFSLCAPSLPDASRPVRMTALRLSLGSLAPPSVRGLYRWRATVTPLAPDGRSLLPAKAYEARAVVPVPHLLTLAASPASGKVVLHGLLTAAGKPRANVAVHIVRLARIITSTGFRIADRGVGWALTTRSGAFALRVRVRPGATYVAVAPATSGRCAAPCVSATYPGVQSDPVTLPG